MEGQMLGWQLPVEEIRRRLLELERPNLSAEAQPLAETFYRILNRGVEGAGRDLYTILANLKDALVLLKSHQLPDQVCDLGPMVQLFARSLSKKLSGKIPTEIGEGLKKLFKGLDISQGSLWVWGQISKEIIKLAPVEHIDKQPVTH